MKTVSHGAAVPQVAIIGAGRADGDLMVLACRTGALVAEHNWTLICGGMGGVMEAASEGARSRGGVVIGLLPGTAKGDGNPYLDVSLPTGLGEGRNVLVARAADALIAIGGEYGTLSEIALGLKMGKPVVSLRSWTPGDAIIVADSPEEAVALVAESLSNHT